MFNQARMRLTLWYILISLCISITFSLFLYYLLTRELERFVSLQRNRIERRFEEGVFLSREPLPSKDVLISLFDPSLMSDIRHKLLISFLCVNGGIAGIAGILGYILASRTLKPIQEIHEKQKRFISDSSHELRTPLTAMKTTLEVASRDKTLTITEVKEIFSDTIEEVNRLDYLTNNLLQLAEHDSQQYSKPGKISLANTIEKSLKRVTILAKEKKIEIEKKIVDTSFIGYEAELCQLFVILLENAIKYSQPDSLIVLQSKVKASNVIVNVIDTGIGISAKDQKHIFDRFYRSDNARSKQATNGYGLGLSIAKQIVELHQGTITVKSNVGKGSVFSVRLPIKN